MAAKNSTARPRDTHPDAYDEQMCLYRAMSAQRRGEMAMLMSDDARAISRAGIRLRNPQYSEREVTEALVGLLYGSDLARQVWP